MNTTVIAVGDPKAMIFLQQALPPVRDSGECGAKGAADRKAVMDVSVSGIMF